MGQRARKIEQMQSEFTKITQYATELQMYTGLREIEKITSKAARYIDHLESGDHFNEKNLEVSVSSALKSILYDVKSFGNIEINTTSSTLQIKTGRKNQAQHLFSKVPGIEDIKPSLLKILSIPDNLKSLVISVCLVLPDGKFILIYFNNKKLLLFSNEGIFIRQIVTFKDDLYDICYLMNNTIAVTFGRSNQTVVVDVQKNTIIKTIKLSHNCHGVASDGKTLVIRSDGSQITIVNLIDMSQTILQAFSSDCISLFQESIYCTNYNDSKICCFKTNGEPLWTFEHKDIDGPAGITLDMHGFVYIASHENESIVVVSPDGKTCKTILSEADGIIDPWAIDIDKQTGMMIVSSQISDAQTAFVYKV